MARSPRDFLIRLYSEYLENGSFFYGQLKAWLNDPELSWQDLREVEDRLEAILDGLVLGGTLALQVCADRLREGDFGEAHTAVRVYCRHGDKAAVTSIVRGLTLAKSEHLIAVADALKQECPDHWLDELEPPLSGGDEAQALLSMYARLAGYRRWRPARPVLERGLEIASPEVIDDVLRALGRTTDAQPSGTIPVQCFNQDGYLRESAAQAVLARRDENLIAQNVRSLTGGEALATITAVAGGGPMSDILRGRLRAPGAPGSAVLALGMLGDPIDVPFLLDLLGRGLHPALAAEALNLILGASIIETVFVPDEPSGDEEQQPRLRPDGKPYGVTVTRLSWNAKRWKQWWAEHEPRFSPGVFYRLGKPICPEAIVTCIESSSVSTTTRSWAADEIRLRYGYQWDFDVEMPVARQVSLLKDALSWAAAQSRRFQQGKRYFDGHLQA